MRVLAIGKYPPVQGGVSTQMYDIVWGLARKGHDVVLVTNALSVEPNFRMHMTDSDWRYCRSNETKGKVAVVWTEPYSTKQSHIPRHDPFTTKLYAAATRAAERIRFDAVFSFYLEPYSIVGDLIARDLGIPHIIRTAGSDVGRLFCNVDLQRAYLPVLGRATKIWTSQSFSLKLCSLGISKSSIITQGSIGVNLDRFQGSYRGLDLKALSGTFPLVGPHAQWGVLRPDMHYIGVYGKFDQTKRLNELLDSVERFQLNHRNLGVLLMGGGYSEEQEKVRRRISATSLSTVVVRIPFLPPWRVPAFLKYCHTICCLEQDFSIPNHNPVIAREALAAGKLLIASTEVLQKLPYAERLVAGFNCLGVADTSDVSMLYEILDWAISHPSGRKVIQDRAREYAKIFNGAPTDCEVLEGALFSAIGLVPKRRRVEAIFRPKKQRLLGSALKLRATKLMYPSGCGMKDLKENWNLKFVQWVDAQQNPSRRILKLRDLIIVLGYTERLKPQTLLSASEHLDSVFRLPKSRWGYTDDSLKSDHSLKPVLTSQIELPSLFHDADEILSSLSARSNFKLKDSRRSRKRHLIARISKTGACLGIYLADEAAIDFVRSLCGPSNETPTSIGPAALRLFSLGLIRLTSSKLASVKATKCKEGVL